MVGVDTVNIDSSKNLSWPAHTKLLKEEIIIIESLVNLESLENKTIRFYAVTAKFENLASFPVKAFAKIVE